MRKLYKVFLPFCFFVSFCSGTLADENIADEVVNDTPTEVATDAAEQTEQTRSRIISEAVDALSETHNALTALDEGRTDDAMDALAMAVGKLELTVARHPELALAPTSMTVQTRDVYGSTAAVKEAIKQAEKLLGEGNVQAARHILRDMGSEVVITLTNLPLATYPDTIKAISPLIDDGKTEQAKAALQTVLNTLVVTEQVIPLPIARSQAMLSVAEALADQESRSQEQEDTLHASIEAVREQIELGELLGYGEKTAYKKAYRQLGQLEKRLQNNDAATKQFAETREALTHLWQS